MFKLQRGKTEALTVASNIVLWEIVRHMKPFTDGEFIKECMIKVAAQMFPDKPDIQRAFEDIPLSARTVVRRADMLSSNIKDQYQYLLFLLRHNKNRKKYTNIEDYSRRRKRKKQQNVKHYSMHTVIFDIIVRRMMHGCNTLHRKADKEL